MNMRFIRNFQRNAVIRERIVEVLSKLILIGISLLVCLWMISGAHAEQASITGIKSYEENGSRIIDLNLSQKPDLKNISVEFDRNFIQISLKGVSAYPARTENIGESILDKVFTYQYQPDLARARVLLNGTAASVKGKTSWELTAQGVKIRIKSIAAAAAAKVSDSVKIKSSSTYAASSASAPITTDAEEERVVQEILDESKAGGKAKEESLTLSSSSSTANRKPAISSEEQPLFGAKTGTEEANKASKETSIKRILASLLLVLGLIGATAMGYRRFALGKGIPFQKQNKLIDIIANQSMGPKRSIALVKVLDQYMVIGMAGDGMNLLSNLGNNVDIEKFIDAAGGDSFTDMFDGVLGKGSGKEDSVGKPIHAPVTHQVAGDFGIRTSIKKRLAGFKPL